MYKEHVFSSVLSTSAKAFVIIFSFETGF